MDNDFRQAIDPYKENIKSGKLMFVSADTLDMQMQQLKDGLSDGQNGQRPFQMGYLAMQRLLDLKNGKTLQDPEYTGLDVCTNENAADCLGKVTDNFIDAFARDIVGNLTGGIRKARGLDQTIVTCADRPPGAIIGAGQMIRLGAEGRV